MQQLVYQNCVTNSCHSVCYIPFVTDWDMSCTTGAFLCVSGTCHVSVGQTSCSNMFSLL